LLYDCQGFIGGLIGWFSGGNKMHSSIVSSIVAGKIIIIEAHLGAENDQGVKNKGRVHEKTLNVKKWGAGITVKRVRGGINLSQANKLIKVLRLEDVGITKYDLESFPSMFFRSRIGQIFGWKKFRKDRPILNNPQKQVCSTLIATRYEKVLGIDICEEVNAESVTPSDLQHTKSLSTVC